MEYCVPYWHQYQSLARHLRLNASAILNMHRLQRIIIVAAVLFAQVPALHAQEQKKPVQRQRREVVIPADVQVIRDVVYRDLCDGEDAKKQKNKLDLFLPKEKKDFPVMIFVHGGAWRHGDKNHFGLYSSLGAYWAHQGVAVAVINYRLSPEVKHPEHVKDVAKAFAWVHKNITTHGGRADQIFLCGHSAGGHLVSLLATDETWLKAEGLSSKSICGVIPISGVYRVFGVSAGAGLNQQPDEKDAPVAGTGNAFLNSIFGPGEAVHRAASPLVHVHPDLPPFLVVCADKDLPLLPEQAKAFAAALKAKKCEVNLLEVADRNHMSVLMSSRKDDDPVGKAMKEFIMAHTKK